MAFVVSRRRSATTSGKADLRPSGGSLAVFAGLSLAGGLLALVVGIVMILIRLVFPNTKAVGDAGTLLIIVTIPLLLTGSHLMDMIDKKRAAARERTGVSTEQDRL